MNSLITYAGQFLIDVDVSSIKDNLRKTISLRPNNTMDVSSAELGIIKSKLGDLAFKRFVTLHDTKRIQAGVAARKRAKEKAKAELEKPVVESKVEPKKTKKNKGPEKE